MHIAWQGISSLLVPGLSHFACDGILPLSSGINCGEQTTSQDACFPYVHAFHHLISFIHSY
jgi:hypothetical protein